MDGAVAGGVSEGDEGLGEDGARRSSRLKMSATLAFACCVLAQSFFSLSLGKISMKRFFILIVTLLSSVAFAQKTSTVGLGASSCGSYTKLRAAGDEDSRKMVGFYIQGYLSGANLGMLANKRPSKSIPDGDALVSFVDTYCKRNPLERVDAALIDLYIQLK